MGEQVLWSARSFVSQLRKEPDELKKKLLFVGYVTDRLERKSESVYLVGGQAVETYTGGEFITGDVDIPTTDRKTTEQILEPIRAMTRVLVMGGSRFVGLRTVSLRH